MFKFLISILYMSSIFSVLEYKTYNLNHLRYESGIQRRNYGIFFSDMESSRVKHSSQYKKTLDIDQTFILSFLNNLDCFGDKLEDSYLFMNEEFFKDVGCQYLPCNIIIIDNNNNFDFKSLSKYIINAICVDIFAVPVNPYKLSQKNKQKYNKDGFLISFKQKKVIMYNVDYHQINSISSYNINNFFFPKLFNYIKSGQFGTKYVHCSGNRVYACENPINALKIHELRHKYDSGYGDSKAIYSKFVNYLSYTSKMAHIFLLIKINDAKIEENYGAICLDDVNVDYNEHFLYCNLKNMNDEDFNEKFDNVINEYVCISNKCYNDNMMPSSIIKHFKSYYLEKACLEFIKEAEIKSREEDKIPGQIETIKLAETIHKIANRYQDIFRTHSEQYYATFSYSEILRDLFKLGKYLTPTIIQ